MKRQLISILLILGVSISLLGCNGLESKNMSSGGNSKIAALEKKYQKLEKSTEENNKLLKEIKDGINPENKGNIDNSDLDEDESGVLEKIEKDKIIGKDDGTNKPNDLKSDGLVYLENTIKPFAIRYYKGTSEESNYFSMTGIQFTKGFFLNYSNAEARFRLDQQYTTLKCMIGKVDSSSVGADSGTLNIYVDQVLKEAYNLEDLEYAKEFLIDVSGGTIISFKMDGTSNAYGIGNPLLE